MKTLEDEWYVVTKSLFTSPVPYFGRYIGCPWLPFTTVSTMTSEHIMVQSSS